MFVIRAAHVLKTGERPVAVSPQDRRQKPQLGLSIKSLCRPVGTLQQ
jgi:hypothetical protein